MPPPKKLVVGPAGAAELLDLSEWSIFKLIREGELETFELGGSRKITIASVEALIRRRLAARRRKIRNPPAPPHKTAEARP
jgi:hypothetical protein